MPKTLSRFLVSLTVVFLAPCLAAFALESRSQPEALPSPRIFQISAPLAGLSRALAPRRTPFAARLSLPSSQAGGAKAAAADVTAAVAPRAARKPQAAPPLAKLGAGLKRRIYEHARSRGFLFDARKGEEPEIPVASGASQPLDPASSAPSGQRREPPSPKRVMRGVFAVTFVNQYGVEMMALVAPQLANQLAGHQASSILGAASFAALTVGSLLGGAAIQRMGLRPIYLAMLALRTVVVSALVAVHGFGALTLPLFVGIFSVDYFFLGAQRVAESVIPAALSSSRGEVAGFGNATQMVIESVSFFSLLAGGALLARWHFGGALLSYAVAIGASVAIAAVFVKVGSRASALAGSGLKKQLAEVVKAMRQLPALRLAVSAYVANIALSTLVYFAIATGFAKFTAGHASPLMTTVCFAVGGFIATALVAALNALAKKRAAASPAGDQRHNLLLATKRWLLASAVVLLGSASFALSTTLGIWPALAFMVAYGITSAATYVHLEAFLKTEAPEAARASIMGIVRAMGYAGGAAACLAVSAFFAPTAAAFWGVAGLFASASLLYALASRKLR